MRVMLRQLRTHREDRPLVVRSLRAMLILVPLFGLQQFFIIYRPQPSDQGFYVYEVCSAAIMNLQVRTLPKTNKRMHRLKKYVNELFPVFRTTQHVLTSPNT